MGFSESKSIENKEKEYETKSILPHSSHPDYPQFMGEAFTGQGVHPRAIKLGIFLTEFTEFYRIRLLNWETGIGHNAWRVNAHVLINNPKKKS